MTPAADTERVVILVMAAGRSRRFGPADKRLARLADGRTLLAASLAASRALSSRRLLVVRDGEGLATLGLDAGPGAPGLLVASRADAGLGASLGDAFTRLLDAPGLEGIEAAAVWLGDMPAIAPATCRRLAAHAAPGRIVRPRHAGRAGHPVLFGRAFWPRLARLDGVAGARGLILDHPGACREIEVDDGGVHRDVDTPAGLAALMRSP
ncbi:Purine catabolism protein PucB [Halomonas sp. THAF5a]|uniref:nucleotidyltransferase family protein n=1 Tax=Halomonas sp. THAF5a TaxID=2587844 RepID=UPI0012A9D21D|nr:nucleotidyltransferase family protein [Halomonas sp. THAF5a]QFU01879.1 Purine catabolism protein PucB [Halomonas sp. THAF5a]